MMDVLLGTLGRVRAKDKAAAEVLRQHETELTAIQQTLRDLRSTGAKSLQDLFPDLLRRIREIQALVEESGGRALLGISTGLEELDFLTGGWQVGLHGLGAGPGAGKTTLALQWTVHASAQGVPAIFLSFEEALDRLALSAICCKGKLDKKMLWEGRGDADELAAKVAQHGDALSRVVLLEGNSRVTPMQLKALALQTMQRFQSTQILIVVDYIQRWAAASGAGNDMRHAVTNLVNELRGIAMATGAAIIVISSQSKVSQNSFELNSFKEAAELEYGVDSAMLLGEDGGRRDEMPPHQRALKLALKKNRYGDVGDVYLTFTPARSHFETVGQ
jgi:replicative DNA helicase